MNKFLLLIICFLIGILFFNMLKNHCDCKVVEGQRFDGVIFLISRIDATDSTSTTATVCGSGCDININDGQITIEGIPRDRAEMTMGEIDIREIIDTGINIVDTGEGDNVNMTININTYIDTILTLMNAINQGGPFEGIDNPHTLIKLLMNLINSLVRRVPTEEQDTWRGATIGANEIPVETYFPFVNAFIQLGQGAGIAAAREVESNVIEDPRTAITRLLRNTNAADIIQGAEEGEWEVYVDPNAAAGGDQNIVHLLRTQPQRIAIRGTFNARVVNNVTNAIFRIEGNIFDMRFTYMGQRENPGGGRGTFTVGSAVLAICQYVLNSHGGKGFGRL